MPGSILLRVLGLVLIITVFSALTIAATDFLRIGFMSGAGILALAAGAAFIYARRLLAPIAELRRTLELLAEGRTDIVVPNLDRGTKPGPSPARSRRSARTRPPWIGRSRTTASAWSGGRRGWSGATGASAVSNRP